MAAEPAAGRTITSQLSNAAMSAAMEERMLRLLHGSPGDRQDIAAAIARALQPATGQHEAAVVSGQEATLSPRFIDLWISQVAEPRVLESSDIVWMVHRELLQRYGIPVEWRPSNGPYVPPQQPAQQQQQPASSHDQQQQMLQQQEQKPALSGQQQQPDMQQQEPPDVGSESDDEPPRPTRVIQSRAERKQRRNFAAEAGETGDFLGDGDDMEEGTPPPRQQPRAPQLPQSLEETEARLKPGTIKHCALQVLKDAGARGMAIDDIMAAVSAQGLRQWDANSKRVVQFALSSDEAFVRTSKGVYALSCLAGISQRPTARNPRSQKKPRRHAVDEGWDGEMNGYPDDGAPDGWSYEDSRLDSYARAEKALSRAQAAIIEQRSRLEKAHVAVEEAEAKAAAAERKAKAAAPSKRKRESAALVAQHAALVAVADAIPQVAAVLSEQHAAQQAKRQARGSQSPAAQPADGTDAAGAADGQQAHAAAGQQAGEQAGPPPQQQQQQAAVAGAATQETEQPVSSAAPQHLQQQQQPHLQQGQPQQPQQSAAMLQQQHSAAMAQLAAAGLPPMPMFNPAIPATAQFPLGGAPPFGVGPGDGGVWAQILASLPSASGGPDAQQALPGSWLQQQSAALAAAQQAGSPVVGDPHGAAQHRQHQQPQQQHQHQPQQQQSDDPPDMGMMEAVVNALPGSGEMVETPNGVLEMPDFGLTEAEKEYHGPPDDRRALMAHRKWLQEEMDKREEIRERWLRKVQGRKGRAVAQRGKEAAAAQRQARRAVEAVTAAERALAAAEAAAVEAEKSLEREALRRLSAGGRGGAAGRERDRRRAAAEAARKFPMEDAALMALLSREAAEAGEAPPDFSVPGPPEVLPQAESDRLAPALFVADFLGHFGRALGIRRMPLAELQRRLGLPDHMASLQRSDDMPAAAAGPGSEAEAATGVQPMVEDPAQQQLAGGFTSAAPPQSAGDAADMSAGQPISTAAATDGLAGADGTAGAAVKAEWDPASTSALAAARDEAEDCSLAPVYALYEALLRMLLQDCAAAGKAGRMERRWDAILGPGTWPEVLRRYALNRSAKAPGGIVGEVVLGAVAMLGGGPVVDLTAEQHLALLSFLCDEALDTALLRNLLQKRLEDADALRRHAKGGLAEERRRQKGPRSRKSAGSMASVASLKAERDGSVLRDDDAASVGLAEAGEGTPQPDSQPGGAAELERKQEELEQQLELCCVRRAPLGADRLGARYWWGLASQPAAVWVEAPPAPDEQQKQQEQSAADVAADNKASMQAQQGNGQALVHQPQLPPQPSPARKAKQQQHASPQRQLLHQQQQHQAMSPQQQLLMQLHAQQQTQQSPQAQLETHLRLQQELALLQQRQAAIAHFPPEQRPLLQQQVNAHLAELQAISASLGAFPHQNGGGGFANGGSGFGGGSSGAAGLPNGGSSHIGSNGTLLLPGVDQQNHPQQQRQLDLASWHSGRPPAGFSLSGFGSPAGGVLGHAAANGSSAAHNADGLPRRQRKQDAEEQPDRFGATSWPLRDPAPVWGMLTEAGQLEAVAAALDERGERDAALLGTLQKRLPEISAAMAEGHTAVLYSDDEYDRAAAAPVRQSRRIAGPGDAADGGSGRAGSAGRARPGSGGSHDTQHGIQLELPAVESAALAAAAEQLSALCTAAAEFGIPEPLGGWQRLEAAVHAVVIGQAPAVATADISGTDTLERRTLEALRSAASEAEDAMWAAACTAASEYARNTGQSVANLVGAEIDAAARAGQSRKKGDGSDSEADYDEDADTVADRASSRGEAVDGDADGYDSEGGSPGADRDASEPLPDGGVLQVLELSDGEEEKKALKRSGGRPSRARGAPRLWRSLRERALWRVDLAAAGTIPRVAYCCIVLAVCGGELLETLEARQRRAEQRRSSRIPLNPPPLAGRAAEKARKAAEKADAEVAELGQRRRKAAGSYQVLAGKGFGGY